MPAYAKHTLQNDEKVICVAHLHWIIYLKALSILLLSSSVLLIAWLTPIELNRVALTIASALLVLALRAAIIAWWNQFTTEMVVTDRRVIYKRGFIWRHTAEMFISKIESVFVDQTFWGRLLNFGSIHCRGTGESIEHLYQIADPLAVQTAINIPYQMAA